MRIIGLIFSVSYIFLFYAAWVAYSLSRPIFALSLLFLLARPHQAIRKIRLFAISLIYLVLCNDKRWTQPDEDPASFFALASTPAEIQSKTIIFVRHGESTWNDTFNKGDRKPLNFAISFLPNLFYAMAVEIYLFVAGHSDQSWFFDSPLSQKGVRQATDLRKFLVTRGQHATAAEKEIWDLLTGKASEETSESGDSGSHENGDKRRRVVAQICSSNLRRAISTVAVSLQDRLDQQITDDKILILPQLQEISRNPDALSIAPPYAKELTPTWTDKEINGFDFERIFKKQVDTSLMYGNKPISTNGLKRMKEFCSVAFDKVEKDALILGGHSLWFRSFFRTFLPRDFTHLCKTKKLVNGGVASFTLLKKGEHYMIDPKSIRVIYGGF